MRKTDKSNDVNQLKQAIKSYCEKRDYVTFLELTRELKGFQLHGSSCIEFPGTNMVVWHKMSDCFVEALIKLLNEEIIVLQTVPAIRYVLDGGFLSPIAFRRPKKRFAVRRWAPCCVRLRSNVTEREMATYQQSAVDGLMGSG